MTPIEQMTELKKVCTRIAKKHCGTAAKCSDVRKVYSLMELTTVYEAVIEGTDADDDVDVVSMLEAMLKAGVELGLAVDVVLV